MSLLLFAGSGVWCYFVQHMKSSIFNLVESYPYIFAGYCVLSGKLFLYLLFSHYYSCCIYLHCVLYSKISNLLLLCIFLSAIVSASLLYYFGIPSNEKSLNLLQWLLQLLSMYVIYTNCYSKQFSITIIIMLVIFQFVSFLRMLTTLLRIM